MPNDANGDDAIRVGVVVKVAVAVVVKVVVKVAVVVVVAVAVVARGFAMTDKLAPTGALARRETIRQLFEQWLADKLGWSVVSYRTDLQDFANFMRVGDAADALSALLEIAKRSPGEANAKLFEYRAEMLSRPTWSSTTKRAQGRPRDREGMAPATVNRRLCALRSVLRVLRTAGQTAWVPEVAGVKAKRYRDTRGAGDDGVRALLHLLKDELASSRTATRWQAHRDLAIVRLMAGMGLRKGSVLSLDMEHVDRRQKRLHVQLKGDRERVWKYLDNLTWSSVEAWLEVRGPNPGAVFCTLKSFGRMQQTAINRMLERRSKQAGIERARPHGLRHTAITRALDMGMNIVDVSRFADHAKIDTTMVYDDRRHREDTTVPSAISDYDKPTKK